MHCTGAVNHCSLSSKSLLAVFHLLRGRGEATWRERERSSLLAVIISMTMQILQGHCDRQAGRQRHKRRGGKTSTIL